MRGFVRFRVLAAILQTAGPALAQTSAATPPAPCSSPEYRQFDFWLGDWKVQDTGGNAAGTNQITSIQGGCVLYENWTGARGGTGNSFNMYSAVDRRWHQTWVDNQGGRLDLSGGIQDGKMVLWGETPASGDPSKRVKQRISWEKKGENVRQLWQTSRDGGKTWSVIFDGLYERATAK